MAERQLRILIAALGSHGDMHPFLGLAGEFRRRGHEVTVIGPAIFAELARMSGFDFVSIGTVEQFQQLTQSPELWKPVGGFFAVADAVNQLMPAYYSEIARRQEPGRTRLVMSTLAFGGRVAQEKLKIPTITVHLSPSVFRSTVNPPVTPPLPVTSWTPIWWNRLMYCGADRLGIDRILGRPLNGFHKSLDLPSVKGILREWIHSPDLSIGLFPEWFAPPAPDWPTQAVLTGFPLYDESDVTPGDPALEKFLEAGDPPIAFTPGSAMRHGREFFSAAVEACRLLGRRGLLLSRHSENIPANLPPEIRYVEYAPFSRLLPRCAGIVHHGGIGTTAQSLAAGIPQVVAPMGFDQFDNAARLKRLGVSETLPARKFYAARAAAALSRAIDPAHRAACGVARDRLKGDNSLARTVDLIEQMK